ncbi:MAG: PF20097 family protein [Candidatus Bathyarchaeia archaeon]|jgi:hypothetical protein
MNEAKNCPKCGGELEKGVMQLSPRGGDIVFWGALNIEEKLIAQYWQIRDLPAWRCKKCQLAVFLYGENKGVKP